MADPYAFQSSGDRGLCPVCERSITVTRKGVMRTHGQEKDVGSRWLNCPGSGQKPKDET